MNGQWVRRGMIRVFVPDPEPRRVRRPLPESIPRPEKVRDLIACPTCHAKAWQSCRTPSGNRLSRPHKDRLVGRLCPCGEKPKPNATYCEPCALAHDRTNHRNAMAKQYAKRRAAR